MFYTSKRNVGPESTSTKPFEIDNEVEEIDNEDKILGIYVRKNETMR